MRWPSSSNSRSCNNCRMVLYVYLSSPFNRSNSRMHISESDAVVCVCSMWGVGSMRAAGCDVVAIYEVRFNIQDFLCYTPVGYGLQCYQYPMRCY